MIYLQYGRKDDDKRNCKMSIQCIVHIRVLTFAHRMYIIFIVFILFRCIDLILYNDNTVNKQTIRLKFKLLHGIVRWTKCERENKLKFIFTPVY